MKIGAIIQARSASTRLPQKVLKELPYGSGITVLEQVIRRAKKSSYLDKIIIASTVNKEDDRIIKIAEKEGVLYFRGSEKNVLSRYYHAASENSLGVVVRITSDCPCIDMQIVDHLIDIHLKSNVDYTSNSLKRSYPHGLDAEVFSFEVLRKAFEEAEEDYEKEHVTPYIYRTGKFRVQNIDAPKEFQRPDIRITLDTKEDYAILCAVYDFLYYKNPFFGTADLIGLFNQKPWLKYINEKIVQKEIFNNLEEELKEAVKILDLQDLQRACNFLDDLLKRGL